MQPVISRFMWVSLPNEVRYKIRKLFNIPQSSNVVVNDGRIESDGVTDEDLGRLTILKMQEYLDDPSEDFHKLFDLTVAKVVNGIQNPNKEEITVIESDAPMTVIIEPKKKGRPAKAK